MLFGCIDFCPIPLKYDRDLVTRCRQDSNHLASFRMKMDIIFMIVDSALESESWIRSRILSS